MTKTITVCYREMGLRIHNELQRQNKTQTDLAAALGVPQGTMSQKMRGKIRTSALELAAIADFLDIPMETLTAGLREDRTLQATSESTCNEWNTNTRRSVSAQFGYAA